MQQFSEAAQKECASPSSDEWFCTDLCIINALMDAFGLPADQLGSAKLSHDLFHIKLPQVPSDKNCQIEAILSICRNHFTVRCW